MLCVGRLKGMPFWTIVVGMECPLPNSPCPAWFRLRMHYARPKWLHTKGFSELPHSQVRFPPFRVFPLMSLPLVDEATPVLFANPPFGWMRQNGGQSPRMSGFSPMNRDYPSKPPFRPSGVGVSCGCVAFGFGHGKWGDEAGNGRGCSPNESSALNRP